MSGLQNAIEHVDPLLGGTAQILRNTHPCRILERDGVVVGCWFTTNCAITPSRVNGDGPKGVRVSVLGAMRTADGRVVGIRGMRELDDGLNLWVLDRLAAAARAQCDERPAAEQCFTMAVDGMLRFVARSGGFDGDTPFAATLQGALQDLLGWRPSQGDMERVAKAWAADTARKMMEFLRTLDPWALRLLTNRRDLLDLFGAAWPGLDRTFETNAPLRVAVLANPNRARLALHDWPSRAQELRAALNCGTVDRWLDEAAVTNAMIEANMLPDLIEAERALPVAVDGRRPEADGNAASLVRRTARLAASDRPQGNAGWRAFRDLTPIFDELARWEGLGDPVGLLLGAGSDWGLRLGAVTESWGNDDLQTAVDILGAMSTAFARQILMPGASVARGRALDVGRHTWEAWSNAGHAVLLNGRPLAEMLQAASRWASGDGFALASPGLLASVADVRWPAILPDRRIHRFQVDVVRDATRLLDEVARTHPARSGLAHHDALRLLDSCTRGTSRLAVVRAIEDDRTAHTVCMIEVSLETSPYSVVGRHAPQGQIAHLDENGVVSRYIRHLRERPAPLGVGDRASSRAAPSVGSLCGFEWRDQDRWREAFRAWEPFLSPSLRSAEPWQVARLVGAHLRSGPPHWAAHLKLAPLDNTHGRNGRRTRESVQTQANPPTQGP